MPDADGDVRTIEFKRSRKLDSGEVVIVESDILLSILHTLLRIEELLREDNDMEMEDLDGE